ncbi:Uncharacterised protein [Enterobacter cloacae]|nr:Uncharacterised protein [Enterobacter cloacae]
MPWLVLYTCVFQTINAFKYRNIGEGSDNNYLPTW